MVDMPIEKRKSLIVDSYVTTDAPLHALVAESRQESVTATGRALLRLQECLDGKLLARAAVQIAQETDIAGADPELAVLMLASWAELACRIGRPSEAEAVLHRIRDVMPDEAHPAVKAATRYAASVFSDVTGNKAERESALREILTMLPTPSPRRKYYAWELALLLAQQGRGMEARDELRDLSWQCNERFRPSRIVLVRFVDAVETGRIQEASLLMAQLQTASAAELRVGRISHPDYVALLGLMHGERPPSPPGLPATQPATWVTIADLLIHRKSDEALSLARLEAKKLLGSFFGSGFEAFGLIRAELAAGHGESAVRLLRMRHARGNRHYLDSLFLARAERLAGNRKLAVRHFVELLDNVKRHQAAGRLDFELRLACELPPDEAHALREEAVAARGKTGESAPPTAPTPPGPAEQATVASIVGRSRATSDLRDTILRFADLNAPILITGETGTGKELVARALHESSRLAKFPFIAVNCGAIAETLLESELFGHERGAFTSADRASKGLFEATGNGTLFLDEIGDISPRLQSALLRVLETGEVRPVGSPVTRRVQCRVVTATNAEIASLAEKGAFRRDLLYRLQRLEIHILPLRERPDDILSLTRHFFDLGRKIGQHAILSTGLADALKAYPWPGNVRELRNVIERMRLMHSDKLEYDVDDLEPRFRADGSKPGPASTPRQQTHLPPPIEAAPATPPPAFPQPAGPERPPEAGEAARPATRTTDRADVEDLLKTGRSALRRLERLRDLFREHKTLTRAEVIEIMDVSPNTATKDLEALCREDFVERVEPSSSSRSFYFRLKGMQHKTEGMA
jgi:DNA-binding NtrC family response regulator